MLQVGDFRWQASTSPYTCVAATISTEGTDTAELTELAGKQGRFVTDGRRDLSIAARDSRIYSPLADHPGLFRTLAEIPANEERIASFASAFGLLWHRTGIAILAVNESGDRLLGEPVEAWLSAIDDLRDAVVVWELIRAQDIARLDGYFPGNSFAGRAARVTGPIYPPRAAFRRSDKPAQPEQILESAGRYLQTSINEHLERGVRTEMRSAGPVTAFELDVMPMTLISSLWLQLSIAVATDQRYKRCGNDPCWHWLEVESPGARATRRYCTPTCKMQDRRAPKDTPREPSPDVRVPLPGAGEPLT